MITAVYQRASDVKQDEFGISLETQDDMIKKFCEYKGYENIKYYTEIKSARSIAGREKLQQLINDIKRGYIKRVIIYRLDRLTRSLRDLMNLLHLFEEHNCELHSTYENIDTSTPSGRMLVQVLGIIAEWESANTSMRVKNSMMLQAQSGKWMSTPPYGFDLKNGKLIINEKEKKLINKAFNLILEKGYSFASAEDYMNKHYGTNWKQDFLTRKIDQQSTIGNMYRNGKVFYNTHEPLTDKETINRLKEIKKSRIVRRSNVAHDDLFRLRIRCYICNSRLSLNAHKRKTRYYYNYHSTQCFKKKRGSVSVSETTLEDALLRYMQQVKLTDLDKVNVEKTDTETQRDELNNRLIELNKKKDRIQRAWINEMMSDEDLQKYQTEIDDERNKILEKLNETQETRNVTSEELKNIKIMFRDAYENLTRNEKIEFIQRYIKEIHFKRHETNHKRRYHVEITSIVFL